MAKFLCYHNPDGEQEFVRVGDIAACVFHLEEQDAVMTEIWLRSDPYQFVLAMGSPVNVIHGAIVTIEEGY